MDSRSCSARSLESKIQSSVAPPAEDAPRTSCRRRREHWW
jgi:hypothetical protein